MGSINLYEIAVSIIGTLPPYLEFLYGIGTVFLFLGVVLIILFPLILIYAFVPKARR